MQAPTAAAATSPYSYADIADLASAASVVVTIAGQDPVTLTGLPQRRPVVLGNVEMTLDVEASGVRGFASATISECGR